jgi:hypothetical protein
MDRVMDLNLRPQPAHKKFDVYMVSDTPDTQL